MTVVIVGSTGRLGTELMRQFADRRAIGLTHADVEIADIRSVEAAIRAAAPSGKAGQIVVINAAAYNLVDRCESDADRCRAVNDAGAANVAAVACAIGATMVHFSTNYVFDGAAVKPYVESDTPRPINVYGASKLAGEKSVAGANPRHYILRTACLYGRRPGKVEDFVEMMLRRASQGESSIEAVSDQWISPTYTRSLACQVAAIIGVAPFGLYHATNQGVCTWLDFAREIFAQTGARVDLRPIGCAELGRPARRPGYSALENAALKALDLNVMEDWRAALASYLRDRTC